MACLSFDKDSEIISPIDTGIPQGSPVSPIVCLFYISPLFEVMRLKHHHVICSSYIEDICLLVEGNSPEENATVGIYAPNLLPEE